MCLVWPFRHQTTRHSRSQVDDALTSPISGSLQLEHRSTGDTADMGNPLSPERLLEIIQSTVQSASEASTSASDEQSSSTSSTTDTNSGNNSSSPITISNSTSLIALLVHAIHTSLGFRQTRPAPPTIDSDGNTSQDPLQRNRVNKEWFESNSKEESFAFEYRHDQSSLVFQVRIGRLGGRTVINAVAVEVSR